MQEAVTGLLAQFPATKLHDGDWTQTPKEKHER